LDDEPIGWIQCWDVSDEPDEVAPWHALGLGHSAAGIDYLVGDPGQRGQGLGAAMIAAFVGDVVFGAHDWQQAAASPFDANAASWKALEKAGFRSFGTFDDPDGPCRLMVADRPDQGATP
ncbi:MAG: GNAT family N-acetyltransferase, partial [Actinomycetota bacterium]